VGGRYRAITSPDARFRRNEMLHPVDVRAVRARNQDAFGDASEHRGDAMPPSWSRGMAASERPRHRRSQRRRAGRDDEHRARTPDEKKKKGLVKPEERSVGHARGRRARRVMGLSLAGDGLHRSDDLDTRRPSPRIDFAGRPADRIGRADRRLSAHRVGQVGVAQTPRTVSIRCAWATEFRPRLWMLDSTRSA